jgi:hypothetical protein
LHALSHQLRSGKYQMQWVIKKDLAGSSLLP